MNNDALGATISLHIPPYSYVFGLQPLHWGVEHNQSEYPCPRCGGLSQVSQLRLGPLTFIVIRQSHDDTHER